MPDFSTPYRAQLARAAQALVGAQRRDGGWGLRPTSVSSIVNSAEALVVLRAAQIDGPSAERGLEFLMGALPLHFRPEADVVGGDGGRGQNIRFLTFFLDAFLNYPAHALSPVGRERIAFCVKHLGSFRSHRGGIPEEVGSNLVSLHQTARTVNVMARLVMLLDTEGEARTPLRAQVVSILDGARASLLRAQTLSGAWPARTGEPGGSAAKTSLATVALAQSLDWSEDPDVLSAVSRGHDWLMANYDSWRSGNSRDGLEKSTDWVHLDYSECLRGALVSADLDAWSGLSKSWRYLLRHWSTEEGLWYEPATDIGNVTIRAAYHTVVAFESALETSSLQLPTRRYLGRTGQEVARLTAVRAEGGKLLVEVSDGSFFVPVSDQLLLAAQAILRGGDDAGSSQIASVLGIGGSSVPVYVTRLNEAIGRASGGKYAQAVRSKRLAGGAATYYFDTRASG